jgi:hypothetical protein
MLRCPPLPRVVRPEGDVRQPTRALPSPLKAGQNEPVLVHPKQVRFVQYIATVPNRLTRCASFRMRFRLFSLVWNYAAGQSQAAAPFPRLLMPVGAYRYKSHRTAKA